MYEPLEFVYIHFTHQEETLKWMKFFHCPYYYSYEVRDTPLGRSVRACWLSEYPNSINLLVPMERPLRAAILTDLLRMCPGADNANIFEPVDATPPASYIDGGSQVVQFVPKVPVAA